jgi:two-component system chemotaxis response regulator CheY
LPGIVVTEAVNGQDAVEKLKKDDIDLIITDINMPEMDGTQLVKWVRESFNKDLPIIIVTTEGEEKEIEEGKLLGANAYITKPVKGQELKETIQGLLS